MTDAGPRFAGVDALLADARSRLHRISPREAFERAANDSTFIVDIRPASHRVAEGEIPGSVIVERNHLEWRLDPRSDARLEQARPGIGWIVVCSEGYTSSLAADSLNSIGVDATDIEGGFQAWAKDGLPRAPGGTEAGSWVPAAKE